MKKTLAASFLALVYVSGAHAEISISNLIESARLVPEVEQFDSDYQLVKSDYSSANGPQLFYAAVVEAHLGDNIESLRYLISGQIRSTTDMSLFEPATESDQKLVAELWGMIFYQLGGAGGTDIYRDEKIYPKILDNISSYNPVIDSSYNPGWDHKGAPSTLEYSNAIAQGKTHRLKQLTDLVTLLQDEEYVALNKELEELQKKADGGGNRALEIINRMREISGAARVPIPQ